MWPGSNPDEEIDPQFNTVNKLSVSIDITNVRLSNAPGDFIFFFYTALFRSLLMYRLCILSVSLFGMGDKVRRHVKFKVGFHATNSTNI
jgi:hypothetical protein